MAALFWLLIICFVYVSDIGIECSDTLTPYQVFKNGQTLVSANQRFQLGFFNVSSKNDHNHRMWMKPLRGSRIKLVLNSVGDLLLRNDERTVIWVCRVAKPASRPELVLLDSGNLVIKDESIAHAKKKKDATTTASILISAIFWISFWFVVGWRICHFKEAKRQGPAGGEENDQDVALFNINAISAATNNFSPDNKIGLGGFGPVYQSDVYSFGVLAIEIISGQKNWGFHHPDHEHNLLGHAWTLWNEGRALELMDLVLEGSSNETEVSRCIQVGLLCVQHRAEERPTMSEVVSMLQDEREILVEPGEPGFVSVRSFRSTGPVSCASNNDSVNGLTVTTLTGRL
ncbi:unnamed protein product [Fraxinus pennsylvanica]|uniref:Uncharacterized protein n=1 Tax=Fraxinus pennsylvanica TaxID=56036 RepID=A0AAD2EC45_9LAMI|nr:unnamed protein product [Fraxinus pennsylvanica]